MNSATGLTPDRLDRLKQAFHAGAASGSEAMQRWLSVPVLISIDSVDQCPLEMATGALGQTGDTVGMCLMQMKGTLSGQMILAFEDSSGLSLSDLLMQQPHGTATAWGEIEISSALESMNILGSAYLNGMSKSLSQCLDGYGHISLIPSPPQFYRDFAESLLQSAFMEQAITGSYVLFAQARFELQGRPLNWTFLLIPDPPSLVKLSEILGKSDSL